jgi:phage terminase large subunit-like protein
VGYLRDLEDELSGFSTVGYVGAGSPNRADAAIWAITELFPGIIKQAVTKREDSEDEYANAGGWMG